MVLLIGNINKGARVILDGNLYVLGRINGDIELKSEEYKIYCESINNSLVKIGSIYEIFTNELRDQMISVFDNKIKNSEYRIGEQNNGKSNSCYIG